MASSRQLVQLHLTCADAAEATKIAQALLEAQLIVCARQLPTSADFRWEGQIDHNDEVLLIMDSASDLFEAVEAVVTPLHDYDTFVLQAVPFLYVSAQASTWIQENLRAAES